MKYLEHNNLIVLRTEQLNGYLTTGWDCYFDKTDIVKGAALEHAGFFTINEKGEIVPGRDTSNRVLLNLAAAVDCSIEYAKIKTSGNLLLHNWTNHYCQIASAVVVLEEGEWIAIIDYDETRTQLFSWDGTQLIDANVSEIPKSDKIITEVEPILEETSNTHD